MTESFMFYEDFISREFPNDDSDSDMSEDCPEHDDGQMEQMWELLERERLVSAAKLMAIELETDNDQPDGGQEKSRKRDSESTGFPFSQLHSSDLSSLFANQQVEDDKYDAHHVLRGRCTSKNCSCTGFKLYSLKCIQQDQVNPPCSDAIRMYLSAMGQSAENGAGICKLCGCLATSHISGKKVQQKQEAEKKKAREATERRRFRVAEALKRKLAPPDENEMDPLNETDIDISGIPRKRCNDCNECSTGFRLIFRQSDAQDPEVMFHCSTCGCSAAQHEVCPIWKFEQEEKRRQQEDMFKRKVLMAQQLDSSRLNAYKILQLQPGASTRDLTKSYRKLSRRYHPDKSGQDGSKFIQLTNAFKLLQENG